MLLCGVGCCLWTRGFSGRRARPWGRAAPWAPRRQAVRAASFDQCLARHPARPCGPSGALHADGAFAADVARRVALIPSYGCQPAISHVIPRRLIQTLNLHRWNCNVFGTSRKTTAINYVRHLAGGSVSTASELSALRASIGASARRPARPCHPRAPQPACPAARTSDLSDALHAGGGGGFCSIRSWLSACRRRVVVLMTPFPPFGGGDVAV